MAIGIPSSVKPQQIAAAGAPRTLNGAASTGDFKKKNFWIVLAACSASGAGVGVLWVLVEAGLVQLYSDPGPPPPMPRPAPGFKPASGARPAD